MHVCDVAEFSVVAGALSSISLDKEPIPCFMGGRAWHMRPDDPFHMLRAVCYSKNA